MGKKSRKKQEQTPLNKRSSMDPEIIRAFSRGRETGIHIGEEEAFIKCKELFSEIDQHVKGIGPSKREDILAYFEQRIKNIK